MIKLFKKSFITTNDCMIITTPLIIFMTLMGWYVSYAYEVIDNAQQIILASITLFAVTATFLSAWLYMAKKAIDLTKQVFVFDNERLHAILGLFKCLLTGIAKLLIPMTWMLSFYIIIYITVMGVFSYFITKFLIPYVAWNAIWTVFIIILTFITLLWIALINSVKKVFRKPKTSLILYIWIALILSTIFIINANLLQHPILAFLSLMIFYYLLVYVVVLLFTCYETIYKEE